MTGDLGWLVVSGDDAYQQVYQSVVDEQGNSYLGIVNRGTIDLAPDESFADNRDLATATDGEYQPLIVKYDAEGRFKWQVETTSRLIDYLEYQVDGVYVGTRDATTKLDAETGEIIWHYDFAGPLAVARDGTSFVLVYDDDVTSENFGASSYQNPEGFEQFYLFTTIDAQGDIVKTQRIGSFQRFEIEDIDIDDSSSNTEDWQVVATGESIDTIYFGDAANLYNESTAGNSNASRFYTPGRDDHFLTFAVSASTGSLNWAHVYEGNWKQKGFEVFATQDGSVYVDGRTLDEGSFTDEPGTTVFNQSRPDGRIHGAGEFFVRFDSDGTFGNVLFNPERFGSFDLRGETDDGLLISIFPNHTSFRSNEGKPSDFTFGEYQLDASIANEYVFEVSAELDPLRPILLNERYYLDGGVRYEMLELDGDYLRAAGVIRGDGQFADGTEFSTPFNSESQRSSNQIFASYFELPATPEIPIAPVATELFSDSFEQGQWNGKWVEDSQNDWFTSTQRSTEGSRSAEIDGYANNASLTMANGVDLTSYDSAELTFDWYIESGLDSGEYLAVDFWNGSSWIETARLSGNVDTENVWHSETIEIDASMMNNDFKARFRGKMSRWNEDANVDNVKLVGFRQADVANEAPTAYIGGPYSVNEGSTVTLDASSSSDPDGSIVSYAWDFDGDGHFNDATGANPEFQTSESGTHNISLQVTDDRGGSATATAQIVVNNVVPTADAGGAYSVELGNSVTLDGLSSFDPGNDIVDYSWDVDGDGVFETFGEAIEFTPAEAGTFAVTLRVTDADGANSDSSASIDVTEPVASQGPNLSHGTFDANGSWQTVTLPASYDSMVVIATPRYNAGSGPGVARIRNATGNSFEVMVANVGATPFDGDIHYVVVEEGVYDEAGFKLEAIKVDVGTTSGKTGGWQIASHGYQQSYNSPVVVGQVMSANDTDWSVFWSSSSSRTSPANSGSLNLGKHVGEDSDTTRASETIGYLVIEATQDGVIEGLPFVAGVGADTVRGVGNGTYQYSYEAMPRAKTAVLSSAGMDGGDGGWPVLMGDDALPESSGTIDLAVDEDQLRDSERSHTTEQVAYFVIDPPAETENFTDTDRHPESNLPTAAHTQAANIGFGKNAVFSSGIMVQDDSDERMHSSRDDIAGNRVFEAMSGLPFTEVNDAFVQESEGRREATQTPQAFEELDSLFGEFSQFDDSSNEKRWWVR